LASKPGLCLYFEGTRNHELPLAESIIHDPPLTAVCRRVVQLDGRPDTRQESHSTPFSLILFLLQATRHFSLIPFFYIHHQTSKSLAQHAVFRLSALMILYFHPLYILVIKIISSILISPAPIHPLYHPLSTVRLTCHFI
jgi:hypothetical protein